MTTSASLEQEKFSTELLQNAINHLANQPTISGVFLITVQLDGSINIHERGCSGDKLSTTSVLASHLALQRMFPQQQPQTQTTIDSEEPKQ